MYNTIPARIVLPKGAEVNVLRPGRASTRRPSVSVVVPCYNYGRYIRQCVESVLNQSGVDVDILIIDDASPDGSGATVRQIAEQDKRIHAICHEKNAGHIATYNEGLAQANGDYTILLSADDLLTPGCLARATTLMEAHPTVGMTYGFALECTDDNVPQARTEAQSWIIWKGNSWIADRCRNGQNAIRSPEAVIRTSVLREIGIDYRADLPHTGDFEMWLRVATVSDIAYIGGADQAYYRIHKSNMHHSTFNLLADMTGRLRAFDTIFAERAKFLEDVDSLRDRVHRRLAVEALGHAISAFTRGVSHQQPVDEYIAFAVATYPPVKQCSEWRTLSKLRASHPRRSLPLLVRERRRRLQYALNWWKWRWAGV